MDDERPTHHVVAAIVRRGDDLLLVSQQGPDDPEPGWALPGGRVEAGESFGDALVREVREETGLAAGPIVRLAYVAEIDVRRPTRIQAGRGEPELYLARALIYELAGCEGEVACDDPDGYVSAAEFVPLPEAIERLERIRYRPMGEPIAAYLRGEFGPGGLWRYCHDPDGALHLVERPPALPTP